MESLRVLSRSELTERIERLAISADAKVLLGRIAETTARVGQGVILIGRQVLSFVFDLLRQFPNTAFGVIVGTVLTMLVASIPFVGAALGALLGPLLIALGLAKGALADLQNQAMSVRISAFESELRMIEARGRA